MNQISIAVLGCGERTRIYSSLLKELMPERFRIVAAADPVAERRRQIAGFEDGDVSEYSSAEAFLRLEKCADAVMIGTQDKDHFDPAAEALKKGYDVVLEKPISNNLQEVLELHDLAVKLGRRVIICHVLRYTPFYNKVKEVINSGVLGEIISLNASEGVEAWHQAHSFVRGHWGNTEKSSPMILAKSCHDMDIISWIIGEKCVSISSYGELTHFIEANAPEGAPDRCTDGCPVSGACLYNAMQYMNKYRAPWLSVVFDTEKLNLDDGGANREEIMQWLKTSPWGRCVYRCDNDAVDHQVVSMKFGGGKTATFTMTAFERGRNIELFGTKGVLKGGVFTKDLSGHDLVFYDHQNEETSFWDISFDESGYASHGGGDYGFAIKLYDALSSESPADISSSIQNSVESHKMAFAAEESRVSGKTIQLAEFAPELN